MELICYSWDDAPFTWLNNNLTWKEGCILQNLVKLSKGHKLKKDIKNLEKEEKDILINLVTKFKIDNDKEINLTNKKSKNKKVKVTIKDVEIFIKEIKEIKVNIFI